MKLVLIIMVMFTIVYSNANVTNIIETKEDEIYTVSITIKQGDLDSKNSLDKAAIKLTKQAISEKMGVVAFSSQDLLALNNKEVFANNLKLIYPVITRTHLDNSKVVDGVYYATTTTIVNKSEKEQILKDVKVLFDEELKRQAKQFVSPKKEKYSSTVKIENIEYLEDNVNNENSKQSISKEMETLSSNNNISSLNDIKSSLVYNVRYIDTERFGIYQKYTFEVEFKLDEHKVLDYYEGRCTDSSKWFSSDSISYSSWVDSNVNRPYYVISTEEEHIKAPGIKDKDCKGETLKLRIIFDEKNTLEYGSAKVPLKMMGDRGIYRIKMTMSVMINKENIDTDYLGWAMENTGTKKCMRSKSGLPGRGDVIDMCKYTISRVQGPNPLKLMETMKVVAE